MTPDQIAAAEKLAQEVQGDGKNRSWFRREDAAELRRAFDQRDELECSPKPVSVRR
jgi:hypothetical protein